MKQTVKDVLDFISDNAFGCFLLTLAALWSLEAIITSLLKAR